MAESTRLTAADIERRLLVRPAQPAPPQPPSPTRLRYRSAVAPMSWFDTATLAATTPEPLDDAEVRALLTADCDRVFTPHGTRWRLLPEVRDETIRRLGSPAAFLRALSAAPADPTDVARTMAEAYLRGTAPQLDEQTLEQLHGTRAAAELLGPLGSRLPSDRQVRDRLGMAELLDPLRRLVEPVFVGRQRELGLLDEYVSGRYPGRDRRRMMIHGPGGVGKSTLVARFVLDHLYDRAGRMPLAYLSFDRGDLAANRPLTLLVEALRQLAVLHPPAGGAAGLLAGDVQATLRRSTAGDDDQRDEQVHLDAFARLLGRLPGGAGAPALWVLDTMEQVQRRGPAGLNRLWWFLDRLESTCPQLRVVLAGRAPLGEHPTMPLPLDGLDDAQALAFLQRALRPAVFTERFLRTVVRRVSSNPLSLKLAAELLRREGATGLANVDGPVLLALLSAEELQGVLYRRILDRLDNPELRRIANPGLVLRRITPDVIQKVLAVPCGLGRLTYPRATQLFEELRREASLVDPVPGENAVVHRADVRRAMLPLLQRAEPEAVASIHRFAVRYYADHSGTQYRAEQLYHRLALGEDREILDPLWDARVEPLLQGSLDELPAGSRTYLANRLRIPVDDDTRRAADSEGWAAQAIRAGRQLIASGQPADAVRIVRERPTDRLDVRTVLIDALASAGRLTEALDQAAGTLHDPAATGSPGDMVALLTLAARIAEDAGHFDVATRWAGQARKVAEPARLTVPGLTAGAAELRAHRRAGSSGSAEAAATRTWLLTQIERLDRQDRHRHPDLVRDLAAELGTETPNLVVDAARLHGVNVEGVAGHVLTNTLGDERLRTTISGISGARLAAATDPGRWKHQTTSSQAGIGISNHLRARPGDISSWAGPLSDAFKAEVDQPVYRAATPDRDRSGEFPPSSPPQS